MPSTIFKILNTYIHRLNTTKLHILTFIILLNTIATACDKPSTSIHTEEERMEIDSVVGSKHDIDSLKSLENKYAKKGNKLGVIVTKREIGKLQRNNSMMNEALSTHTSGLEMAIDISDTIEIIQAYNNIGTDYRRLGMLDLACESHTNALAYSTKHSDQTSYKAKKNRVVSLNGLANVYLSINNMTMADSLLRLALEGEKELDSPIGQAINYANIGSIFEGKGMIDSARIYYNNSLIMNEKAQSNLGIALCHSHLGSLYEQEKKYSKALTEYQYSYTLMSNERDEWHMLESIISLARIHTCMNNLNEARNYLEQAEHTAKKINSIDHLATIYKQFYTISSINGDCNKALEYYILSDTYSDSVVNMKKINDIQNIRINLERKSKKEEIDMASMKLEEERNSKNAVLLALGSGLLLSLIAVLLLIITLKNKIRTEKLKNKLQIAKEHFFTNITHEFRTPLTIILGLSHKMETGNDLPDEEIKEAGKKITYQGNSLLMLINQLLDIAKIKSETGEAHWRTGNIIPYISMLTEAFSSIASDNHVELVFMPKENNVIMDFVPDYIKKIFDNLLSNSIKFTNELNHIYVTTEKKDNKFVITVADNGIGIEKDVLPHIFDPFFQSENDSSNIGTGVGLSLVKQIVEISQGKIKVESSGNLGTIFTIELPLKHGDGNWQPFSRNEWQTAELTVTNTDIEGDAEKNDDNSTRILIVEDNKEVALYIGSLISDTYQVFYAKNGQEAIEKALAVMPDLIITDIMMPVMNGLEMCRAIRRNEIINHIPIIVVSAKNTDTDIVKGIESGADAYLVKPFNAEELTAHISMLIEHRRLIMEKFSLYSPATDEASIANKKTNETNSANIEFVKKLKQTIINLLKDGSCDVESLASEMCMSSTQLRRKILATTGDTTVTFILKVRMEKAKKLLDQDTSIRIGEVAALCGFDDNANFTRAFKQVFDITPSQYKKNQEAKISSQSN